MFSIVSLIGWLLICFAAAGIGLRFPPDAWFEHLRKPSWNPPNRLFAPVWTVLYVLMAVAAWRVWEEGGLTQAGLPLALFLLQLALNAAWTWIFFGWHQPRWAFFEIVVLWSAILATLLAFQQQTWIAGLLLVPYLAWVSFAAVLNFTIWRLNESQGIGPEPFRPE